MRGLRGLLAAVSVSASASTTCGLLGLMAMAGCEVVLGFDDRHLATGAGAGGGGVGGGGEGGAAGPWDCLGSVVQPTPDPTQAIEITLELVHRTSAGLPVTSATIDACGRLDLACEGLEPDLPTGLSVDESGIAVVELKQGFDGFLRATASDLVESRFYFHAPLVASSAFRYELLRPGEHEALARAVGLTLDPLRGCIFAAALNCNDKPGANVRFEFLGSDDSAVPFYSRIDFPDLNADGTDISGLGGVYNIQAGPRKVSSTRLEGNASIGEVTIDVQPGTISYLRLGPTTL